MPPCVKTEARRNGLDDAGAVPELLDQSTESVLFQIGIGTP